jgi:hypothetical protein
MTRLQRANIPKHGRSRLSAAVHRNQVTRLGALGALFLLTTSAAPVYAVLPPGSVVQQWNQIAENTVVASGAFQNEGLIYMAYVSAAVYDAVVAIDGGFEPYALRLTANPRASVDAAVVEAAYTVLRHYFPGQAVSLDSWHGEALALIADGPAKQDGLATGLAAAQAIIDRRTQDGRLTPIGVTSTFVTKEPEPGVWRLTPPAFAAPQTPWVGSVQPFVLNQPGQFHPHPPAPLTSEQWVEQFNEVKLYGADVSAARSAEQTTIARFWTANVIRQYNLLGRELSSQLRFDLLESARLLAMINVVGADAQIAVMHWKYAFLFWRPVTAIDPTAVTTDGFGPVPGFDDGNGRTDEQTGWRPLLATPNHPEYPGAHGSITSAVAEVLTEVLGTEQIDIDIHGFDPAGAAGNLSAVRHFDTAAELRSEIVDARLWGGLHYRASTEAGIDLGRKVAHFDLNHAFRAIP